MIQNFRQKDAHKQRANRISAENEEINQALAEIADRMAEFEKLWSEEKEQASEKAELEASGAEEVRRKATERLGQTMDRLSQKENRKRRSSTEALEIVNESLKEDLEKNLTNALTFGMNKNIRNAARELCDEKLLANLSEGDMVAIEAKYHKQCLIALYNHQRSLHRSSSVYETQDAIRKGLVLAEIIDYITDSLRCSANIPHPETDTEIQFPNEVDQASKINLKLPEYTSLPPTKSIAAELPLQSANPSCVTSTKAMDESSSWLSNLLSLNKCQSIDDITQRLSWSGFHANRAITKKGKGGKTEEDIGKGRNLLF
eukprot:gene12586-13874_t